MSNIEQLLTVFNAHLQTKKLDRQPQSLYEPVKYILSIGGKRIRPVLVLMSAELFNHNASEALDAATAIELFHNFSLIHDDIMDNAPLRRGMKTVHEKYNQSTAILSGDATLVLAYEELIKYDTAVVKKLIQLFNITALEVCEGQQMDMDFETQNNISVADYIKMISLKTAVLLGCAMQMGAIISNATDEDAAHAYLFGKEIGIAFQLQDDLLDTFADAAKFGKQQGGDIIANKKTFLLLNALQAANDDDKNLLNYWLNKKEFRAEEKVEAVKSLFQKYKIDELTKTKMEAYTQSAFTHLAHISLPKENKTELLALAKMLMNREV